MERRAFVLSFNIRHTRAISSIHRLHFTPKAVTWYSFLLGSKYTEGLLNECGRNRSLENFQGPYRV